MNRIFGFAATALFVVTLGLVMPLSAQENSGAAPKKEKELPRSGTLASTRGSSGATKASGVWGGTDTQGTELPPIGGSISRVKAREWQMKLFNNSKDLYSVDIEIVQFGSAGETIKRDVFSYNLRPSETKEQTLSVTPSTADAQLNLTRWKNLSKKAAPQGTPNGAATPGAANKR